MQIGINTLGIAPGWGGAEETFLRHLLRELAKFDASATLTLFTDAENHASYAPHRRHEVEPGATLERALPAANLDVLLSNLDRLPAKSPCAILPYVTNTRAFDSQSRGLFGGSPGKALKSRLQTIPFVLVPSKYTQQRLLQLAEIPLNKIIVAHYGVDPDFSQPNESILEPPYLLAVGNTHPWKRLDVLLQAFHRVQNEIPHNLAIVGRPGEAEPQTWGDRVFRIDRIPQKTLAGLYQHCDAFVRTDPDDHTAVTTLEAMAAGAPILAPRTAAIAEIAGNAPIYYNPDNQDSLIGVLRRIHQMPPDERQRRHTLGKQTAQEFTWERTATQVLKALRRAAEAK